MRHSFIGCRVARIQNVHKWGLEAGNWPRMVFSNYRQLVRTADAEQSFGITPGCLAVVGRRQEAVEAAKAVRQSGAGAKIVRLQVAAAT